jgi:hypothetical protein
MEAAVKFQVGQEVSARSFCDYDCIFRFTVVSRTAKFVTMNYFGEPKRVGIKVNNEGVEYCLPFGNYSMAAIVYANRPSI